MAIYLKQKLQNFKSFTHFGSLKAKLSAEQKNCPAYTAFCLM